MITASKTGELHCHCFDTEHTWKYFTSASFIYATFPA